MCTACGEEGIGTLGLECRPLYVVVVGGALGTEPRSPRGAAFVLTTEKPLQPLGII